jgi:hypothetical protein
MIRHTLPFRSQSWDLTQWERLGFSSETEANYWQDSSCGVLCLGMILDAVSQTAPSTKELIDRGISFKAYTDNTGWSHEGLAALAQSYGLSATKKNRSHPQLSSNYSKRNSFLLPPSDGHLHQNIRYYTVSD